MIVNEKRNHPRCQTDTAIYFSYFNREEKHAALARNYCHSGMYFETDHALQAGVIVLIRSEPCHENMSADKPAAIYCSARMPVDTACRQLKNLVTAQVKRCSRISGDRTYQYGVAVEYVRPSV
jgi:hypothetical protein